MGDRQTVSQGARERELICRDIEDSKVGRQQESVRALSRNLVRGHFDLDAAHGGRRSLSVAGVLQTLNLIKTESNFFSICFLQRCVSVFIKTFSLV